MWDFLQVGEGKLRECSEGCRHFVDVVYWMGRQMESCETTAAAASAGRKDYPKCQREVTERIIYKPKQQGPRGQN